MHTITDAQGCTDVYTMSNQGEAVTTGAGNPDANLTLLRKLNSPIGGAAEGQQSDCLPAIALLSKIAEFGGT